MAPDTPQKPASAPSDEGTTLARERTGIAMERTAWAAERTLMAWIRTALSMIGFGFTIGKLGEALQDRTVRGALGLRSFHVADVAYLLVLLGTLSLLAASIEYAVRIHNLHKRGLPRQVRLALIVAIFLCLLGAFAFTSLVLNL